MTWQNTRRASSIAFDYDGQLDHTTIGRQLGRLSRVHGDGWARSDLYDPLGRVFEVDLAARPASAGELTARRWREDAAVERGSL